MIFCDAFIPAYGKNGWRVDRINLGACRLLGLSRTDFRDGTGLGRDVDWLFQTEADAWAYIEGRGWRAKRVPPDDALAIIAAGMKARGERIRTE